MMVLRSLCDSLIVLSMTINKGKRYYTQQALTIYISYDDLSTSHRVYITKLYSVDIPNTIQEVLEDEN